MDRRGFTLVEVVLAVSMLAIVLVSLARYTGQFMHTVSTSNVRTVAAEVAREQISQVDMDPSYTTLAAVWAGDSTNFPGYPRMRRLTTVSRITGTNPPRDYTVVTVRVSEPSMGQPIDVTTVVAQP